MSHESSTTVTQTDFDAQTYVSDSEVGQGEPDTLNRVAAPDTGGPNSNVFQYMQQVPTVEEYSDGAESHDEELSTVGSSSGSSSGDSEHAGNRSSNAGSSQVTGDTPTTSPASTRRSTHEAPHAPFRKQPKSTKPLYASSFVHGDMAQEEDDASSDGSEAYSDEEGDEEDDEHEHHEESHAIDSGYAHNHAFNRVAPPGVPPTSWPPSDSRASRLRQQERELANHVLQSPQPQKDFQFAGGSPSHPHPSMSMYSPRAHSGATPANFEPTAGYPSEWPPYPPPLAIAYPGQSMLESPVAGHALPLTVQPPMGVSGLPVQQHAPPFHQHLGQPPQYHAHVPASDATKTTAAGYELLANKLSETPKKGNARRKTGTVVPMYRKFEHLNHRVLLHLQDEVCELEEELRYLDDGIVQTSPRDNTTGLPFPASRRGDARYGSELHYKRTELLGRIFQKIGQYSKCHVDNLEFVLLPSIVSWHGTPLAHRSALHGWLRTDQALTSFNTLLKELDPASPDDIQTYRAWMEKSAPIDQTETRFLERKNDLLALSREAYVSTTRGGQDHSTLVWLPLLLAVPLLAFAIVPSLSGRLVVIALIGAAETRLIMSTPELMSYLTGQQWAAAASL
jgi:hypothetical protein